MGNAHSALTLAREKHALIYTSEWTYTRGAHVYALRDKNAVNRAYSHERVKETGQIDPAKGVRRRGE